MIIKYKNYEIVVGNYSYDLYQTRSPKQVHKNLNSKKNVKVRLGYFSKLENCIEQIIKTDMPTREEIVSLRDFLKLYKTFKEDIKDAINC